MNSQVFESLFRKPVSHIDGITLICKTHQSGKVPIHFDRAVAVAFKNFESKSKGKRPIDGSYRDCMLYKRFRKHVSVSESWGDLHISLARKIFMPSGSLETMFLTILNGLSEEGVLKISSHQSWESLLYTRFSFKVECAITTLNNGERFKNDPRNRTQKVYSRPSKPARYICDKDALLRFETTVKIYANESGNSDKLRQCFSCSDLDSLTLAFINSFGAFKSGMTSTIAKSSISNRSLQSIFGPNASVPRRRKRNDVRDTETKKADNRQRRNLYKAVSRVMLNNTPGQVWSAEQLAKADFYQKRNIL